MDALAKAEKIEVSDDEVDAEIATRTEGVSEQVAAEYQKEQARESLRMELAEKAALGLLISHAIIHDSVPEESEAEASDADSDDAEETDTSDTSNES
jgi:FKBP-type peptidyl-prolyl cis-trans isomerase (trigger factor)